LQIVAAIHGNLKAFAVERAPSVYGYLRGTDAARSVPSLRIAVFTPCIRPLDMASSRCEARSPQAVRSSSSGPATTATAAPPRTSAAAHGMIHLALPDWHWDTFT
jgi:hypothetical protein